MDTTVNLTAVTAKRALGIARGLQTTVDSVLSGEPQEPTPEEQLAAIGTLRRQLVALQVDLEDATEELKGSREWDLVQRLKEERKSIQKKLDRAIDGTLHWAQPTML